MRIDLPSPPGKHSYVITPRFRRGYYEIGETLFQLRGYKKLDKEKVKKSLTSNFHFMNILIDLKVQLGSEITWFNSEKTGDSLPILNL